MGNLGFRTRLCRCYYPLQWNAGIDSRYSRWGRTRLLANDYHIAVNGLINQHAWNLLWFGIVTTIGAIFILRNNKTALWLTALIG